MGDFQKQEEVLFLNFQIQIFLNDFQGENCINNNRNLHFSNNINWMEYDQGK